MNHATAELRMQDLASVGTRISWGAIFAGTLLALGVYFLLATLGSAVGLSISDRMNPTNIQTSAALWAFLTTIVALFLGGLVTSLFTAGENKIEAVMSGIIMWALLVTSLLVMSAAGIHAGISAMQGMANNARTPATSNWETAAREAGVPATQIEDWRRKQAENSATTVQDRPNQEEVLTAAKRISWYAFAGTWLAMLAAAIGALVGAGPTFRIVAVQRPLDDRTGSLVQSPSSPVYAKT